MGSPAALQKAGWTQTSVKTGEMVTIKAWKSKNNPTLANADSFMIGGKTMTAVSSFGGAPPDQLARADSRPLAEQTDLNAAPQSTGTSGTQDADASGTQELPSTGSPLALYLLLGGLSLAGAAGVRAIRR
jgi:LPXTG-motif cell wall-anchored protein